MNPAPELNNPWQGLVREAFEPKVWEFLSADAQFADFWRAKVQCQATAMFALGWAFSLLCRAALIEGGDRRLPQIAQLVEEANSASAADMNILEFRQYVASSSI